MTVAKPLSEINREAIALLYREIGVVNTVRFLNQFTLGTGDYTSERRELFDGYTLESIVDAIKTDRENAQAKE